MFLEKLAEATRKYATLVAETSSSVLSQNNARNKKKLPTRKLQELKLAFSEFYLSLILLQNYQNLNFTGFRKILKKHDKVSRHVYSPNRYKSMHNKLDLSARAAV